MDKASGQIAAVYQNDEAFLEVMRRANLNAEFVQTLSDSVRNAFATGTSTCCDLVELSEKQLASLQLGDARTLTEKLRG